MTKSKFTYYIIGKSVFHHFKELVSDGFNMVFLKNAAQALKVNTSQSVIIVCQDEQDRVSQLIEPLFEINQAMLVLFANGTLNSVQRKQAYKQGYNEIIPFDVEHDELTLLLEKFRRRFDRLQNMSTKQATFQQLLDASPAALRIVDSNKKILYSNKRYEEINNAQKEDIIGSECRNYLCAWFCDTDNCAINKIVDKKEPFFFEHVKTDAAGNNVYYLFDVKPFRNAQGEIIGIIESIIDVSHIKKGEMALKQSQDRFKKYIEGSPVGIFITDSKGNYNYVNNSATKLTGYSKHEFKNLNIGDITQQKETAFQLFNALKKDKKTSGEITLSAKNGKEVPVIIDAVAVNEDTFIGYCTDVTLLKKTQIELNNYKNKLEELINQRTHELKIQEEKLKMSYKVGHEGIWDHNNKTGKVFFSPTYYTMLGYKPYEFEQKFESWIKLLHPDDKNTALAIVKDFVVNDEETFNLEFRLLQKDGTYRWIRGRGAVFERDKEGNKIRVVGSHADIHSEKSALISHMKSEAKYKKLVEQINDWIWEVDANGKYTYCSPHVKNILGYHPDEVRSTSPFDYMPPEEAAKIFRKFSEYSIKHEAFSGLINKNYHKNGELVYLETSGNPVFDESGNFKGYMGIDRDVTERVKIEQSIIESEEQFRKIFHTTADLILITTNKGKILNINKAAVDLFKLKFGIYERIKIQDLFQSEQLNSYLRSFKKNQLNVTEIEFDGPNQKRIFEVNGRTIPFKGRRARLNIFKDITIRKELERKVLQTVIDTEEKERSRFAKDLHDGLGPQLSAIRLYINSLGMAAYSSDKKAQMIENAKNIIDNAIMSTKEIANNLMPSVLENFGLVQAVQLFCNDMSEPNKLAINLINDNFNEHLSKNVQIVLYRVISELINNTMKHAQASLINLEFFSDEQENWVIYTDNGKGFKVDTDSYLGNGLQNIKSRVKSISGQIKLSSKPNQGLKVEIKVLNY